MKRVDFISKKAFKKAARKIGSLFIALSLSVSLFTFDASAAKQPAADYTETINIGITADAHINSDDSASGKVQEALLRDCLKDFNEATSNKLDAVAVAGDLTDNGYVGELQTFRSIVDSELAPTTLFTAAMGNHEFYKYGWGVSVDGNPGMKEEMQSDFTTNIKVPVEDDISVKGVHILSVSPDNEIDSYSARESFLMDHIKAAVKENPTNPIIIIAHKPVKYTVMTSGEAPDGSYFSLAPDWSDSFLEFLKQYPQIIYFSGHAHDDISNPDTIFQEDFTSAQAGFVGAQGASTGVLVSIDSNKVVTINRMNFSTDTSYEPAWTINIPKVLESKENFAYRNINTVKDINLTVGTDASEIHVNWYNETYKAGIVQYGKASKMVDGVLTSYTEVAAYSCGEAYNSDFYFNNALLSKLKSDTEYAYRVGNADGWSEYYTFKTPASAEAFSFLFSADAQIGSNELDLDASSFRNTLDNALTAFPETQFLLSAGDQVDMTSDGSQYDAFFSPSQFTSLPIATIAGNHDVNSDSYSQHFAYSNVSADTSLKSTGENSGDYWFVRNNTLFMALNSNVLDTQAHINFMQQAILDAGDDIKWKVVMFHYSIFGSAWHSTDSDIVKRRDALAPALSDLQIDLVLMGHDHLYTRTYMMNGTTPIITDSVQSSVTNPDVGQVLYVTGSSASGSKFYDLTDAVCPYAAVNYQNYTPSISNVDVSDTALTITTYNSTDMTEVDSFTINKTQVSEIDTLKPYLFVPTENTVVLNGTFDKLAGVSAIDNIDGDITQNIMVDGDVNTAVEGLYTLTYTVSDKAGNTAAAVREVIVKEAAADTGFYYGFDIKSGEMKNESDCAVSYSRYTSSGNYVFETDPELNQTVLCGPDTGNLEISGLNLAPLNNQFTVEAYIKIPSTLTAYDAFQFEGQNINLVGFTDCTFFGSGRSSTSGDADVYTEKTLPTDQWIHVLCTAKEGEQTLYVNGVEFSKDYYTGLNITTTNDDNLVLGGTYEGRSGLIKYAYLRIYSSFTTNELATKMYNDMLSNFAPLEIMQ